MNTEEKPDLGDKVTESPLLSKVHNMADTVNKNSTFNKNNIMNITNIIEPKNLFIEKSPLGVFSTEKMSEYIDSLTEEEEANFDKFIRHVKCELPIDFNQRRMIDKAGKPYYFINQNLNGGARTGYKLIILEGFDLFIERMMTETIGFDSLAEIKTELAK